RRETPTQAWRRLGLLQNNEELTRDKYVACVRDAAERLRKEGFFSEKTAAWYIKQAKAADLQPKRLSGEAAKLSGAARKSRRGHFHQKSLPVRGHVVRLPCDATRSKPTGRESRRLPSRRHLGSLQFATGLETCHRLWTECTS